MNFESPGMILILVWTPLVHTQRCEETVSGSTARSPAPKPRSHTPIHTCGAYARLGVGGPKWYVMWPVWASRTADRPNPSPRNPSIILPP
ncbi:hypothetical protein DFJ73DRAFT_836074 [Zopfochytrium polystomum]|nr:hypothetical protein DFJ73DRAFT_836074 [Zopfochytrium polystomum]